MDNSTELVKAGILSSETSTSGVSVEPPAESQTNQVQISQEAINTLLICEYKLRSKVYNINYFKHLAKQL